MEDKRLDSFSTHPSQANLLSIENAMEVAEISGKSLPRMFSTLFGKETKRKRLGSSQSGSLMAGKNLCGNREIRQFQSLNIAEVATTRRIQKKLKIVRRNPCEFDSRAGHHRIYGLLVSLLGGFLIFIVKFENNISITIRRTVGWFKDFFFVFLCRTFFCYRMLTDSLKGIFYMPWRLI